MAIRIDTVFPSLIAELWYAFLMETQVLQDIYFRYAKKVHRYLKSLTFSDDLAFDLMQETFLAADRYYKPGKIENMEAWLISIARNQFKKAASKNSRETEELDGNEPAVSEDFSEPSDLTLLRTKIVAKLSETKAIFSEIFLLRLDLNFTHAQIAKATGLSLITVRRHFEKIRAIIEQNFSEELRRVRNAD